MTRKASHVYVASFSGGHKIGSSNRVAIRMGEVSTGYRTKVKLVRKWKHKEARAVEYAAQKMLSAHLVRGWDWFAVPEDIAVNAVETAIAQVNAGAHVRPKSYAERERKAAREREFQETIRKMHEEAAKIPVEEIERLAAQMRAAFNG